MTGIEEVKLEILSAIGSWASVPAKAVQPDVSFIATGLKEKDTLRKRHLKFLRVICKNSDSLTKVRELLPVCIYVKNHHPVYFIFLRRD
jgi:hypothetical protein